jgi:peptidoglycan/xylan/chitin deacetylase (PgdA/CDA1 family)
MTSWVLMYHRVCERMPETACWFERGTAVTPKAFEAQLDWLQERFEIVSLSSLLEPRQGLSPRVALTFDDGYAEVLHIVAPICGRRGVAGACFASAAPVLEGTMLWFDAWYWFAHQGQTTPGWRGVLRRAGIPGGDTLADCVAGEAKRWLAGLQTAERADTLSRIASNLGADAPPELYLDLDDLRKLQRQGWEIGGHGVHHVRLSDCDELSLQEELRGSVEMLQALPAPLPRLFAYPDGAWDARVARAVSLAGFRAACTVEKGSWNAESPLLSIPRLFCRGDHPMPHPWLVDDAIEER